MRLLMKSTRTQHKSKKMELLNQNSPILYHVLTIGFILFLFVAWFKLIKREATALYADRDRIRREAQGEFFRIMRIIQSSSTMTTLEEDINSENNMVLDFLLTYDGLVDKTTLKKWESEISSEIARKRKALKAA